MYIDSDEQLLRRERLHPAIFALPVIAILLPLAFSFGFLVLLSPLFRLSGAGSAIGLLLLLPEALLALLLLTLTLVTFLSAEVVLTNKRLKFRTGFLARAAGEIPLENVEGLFIFEPLLGRLFGFGTVSVSTVGGRDWVLPYMARPHVLHALVQKAMTSAKAPTTAKGDFRDFRQDSFCSMGDTGGSRMLVPVLTFASVVLLFSAVAAVTLPLLRQTRPIVANFPPVPLVVPQPPLPAVSLPIPTPEAYQPMPQGPVSGRSQSRRRGRQSRCSGQTR
jgi:hypothetical protein